MFLHFIRMGDSTQFSRSSQTDKGVNAQHKNPKTVTLPQKNSSFWYDRGEMLSQLLYQWTDISFFDHRLFRAGAASIFSILFVFTFMPAYTRALQRWGATADFTSSNAPSPPIMGGLLVVISVFISSLAFSHMNAYSVSILVIMIAYATVGAVDDISKVRNKKLVNQGKLSKKDYQEKADGISARLRLGLYFLFSLVVAIFAYKFIPGMDGHLTVPFIKPETWYPYLPNWLFILLICFITTATANGANFTDGLDTLVTVPLITTSLFAGMVAYISGNAIFSDYLLIPFIPGVDELLPICSSIIGSLLAYLWFNCPPASIYMGDSGSIGLGGAIGMMFVLIKAELFLPIVGFIFLIEALSVTLQISGFKLTRKFSKDKTGRRIFLRAPLHDHFKLKWKDQHSSALALNSKVTWRFHLVSIFAFIVGTLIFFKVR